jgi:hypothetical protein
MPMSIALNHGEKTVNSVSFSQKNVCTLLARRKGGH